MNISIALGTWIFGPYSVQWFNVVQLDFFETFFNRQILFKTIFSQFIFNQLQGVQKGAIGQRIVCILPYTKQEIPIMVVFRALGFVADRDILEHIIYDFEDQEMMEMVGNEFYSMDYFLSKQNKPRCIASNLLREDIIQLPLPKLHHDVFSNRIGSASRQNVSYLFNFVYWSFSFYSHRSSHHSTKHSLFKIKTWLWILSEPEVLDLVSRKQTESNMPKKSSRKKCCLTLVSVSSARRKRLIFWGSYWSTCNCDCFASNSHFIIDS